VVLCKRTFLPAFHFGKAGVFWRSGGVGQERSQHPARAVIHDAGTVPKTRVLVKESFFERFGGMTAPVWRRDGIEFAAHNQGRDRAVYRLISAGFRPARSPLLSVAIGQFTQERVLIESGNFWVAPLFLLQAF
jgi:hypothetical protein